MKYALGTVVGTALLGVAKSKLGSGSSKLRPGYKYTFHCDFTYIIDEESFFTLQGNQDILDKIENTIKYYGATFKEFDYYEYEFDDYVDHAFIVSITKSYFTENQENAYDDFEKQFDTLLGKLENAISPILGNCFEDMDIDWGLHNHSTHPYIKNQSGEWVPYESPVRDSKLRKR